MSAPQGDGLLISVHDVVSEAGMMHRVPIFNPGSNTNQRSSLRVINLGDTEANIMVTGIDDMGAAGDGQCERDRTRERRQIHNRRGCRGHGAR